MIINNRRLPPSVNNIDPAPEVWTEVHFLSNPADQTAIDSVKSLFLI